MNGASLDFAAAYTLAKFRPAAHPGLPPCRQAIIETDGAQDQPLILPWAFEQFRRQRRSRR
jgi:hypothetical protein